MPGPNTGRRLPRSSRLPSSTKSSLWPISQTSSPGSSTVIQIARSTTCCRGPIPQGTNSKPWPENSAYANYTCCIETWSTPLEIAWVTVHRGIDYLGALALGSREGAGRTRRRLERIDLDLRIAGKLCCNTFLFCRDRVACLSAHGGNGRARRKRDDPSKETPFQIASQSKRFVSLLVVVRSFKWHVVIPKPIVVCNLSERRHGVRSLWDEFIVPVQRDK
jgi:hypothetical protein